MQFPESTQGFNRYSYVGNNPLSYTDPSGYFSLRKLVRDVGKSLVSFLWEPNPMKEITRAIFAEMNPNFASLTIIIASYYCGPACAAVLSYDYARSQGAISKQARRVGASAAVAAYMGNQAYGSWAAGNYTTAVVTAYTGGYASASISQQDPNRAGKIAVLQLGLRVSMDAISGHESTMDPAREGAKVKSTDTGVRDPAASNPGAEITVPPSADRAAELIDQSLSGLSQEDLAYLAKYNPGKIIQQSDGSFTFSWRTEGGAFMNWFGRNAPGVNAFSVFHDQWMFSWGNIQNSFILGVTIPPAAALQYCALGACTQADILKQGY